MATGTTGCGTQKTECVRMLLSQNQPGAHGGFAADFATADGQRVRVTALSWQQVADPAHATRLAGTFAFLERLKGRPSRDHRGDFISSGVDRASGAGR
jgi:hypothetical protein